MVLAPQGSLGVVDRCTPWGEWGVPVLLLLMAVHTKLVILSSGFLSAGLADYVPWPTC